MDIVTDLTAQSVGFLTIVQDLCKGQISLSKHLEYENTFLWDLRNEVTHVQNNIAPADIVKAAADIVWCRPGIDPDELVAETFFVIIDKLLDWLDSNHPKVLISGESKASTDGTLFCTPFQWRKIIRGILYHQPRLRSSLAEILCYMPVQIILCLETKALGGYEQRLCQVWDPNGTYPLIASEDKPFFRHWWGLDSSQRNAGRITQAVRLLESDSQLLEALNDKKIAVPFETFFNHELDEICKSRTLRVGDDPTLLRDHLIGKVLQPDHTEDPLERALSMDLHGLALSGGGIRSATFSLGVLQKLAEQNKLSRIDYLSTVSGGGYIGTWLASWIKRSGSVAKVTDRLNTKKSADPLGEEVRPIRWLRMFSNYLAPDAAIMSADSWTMGITWLRNTVINQIILLLLLCTALSVVTDCYTGWTYLTCRFTHANIYWIGGISMVMFLPAIFMAGFGMRAFERAPDPKSLFRFGTNRFLSVLLVCWAVANAYFISAWLYHDLRLPNNTYFDKVRILVGAALAALVAMLAIAYLGYYQICAAQKWRRPYAHIAIIGSSALAATAGLYMMAGIWQLLQMLKCALLFPNITGSVYIVHFIIGTPLILELISVCVVIRMALMGSLFPDERREWWGRMGALVHRYMLLWLLISIGALILPQEFSTLEHHTSWVQITGLCGGWGAIVGFAVKLAYSSNEKESKNNGNTAAAKDLFIKLAPYLFMLGFLLLGAYMLQYVNQLAIALRKDFLDCVPTCLLITVAMAGITALLSWRVGVNEFSLHHFYRNRLVRAYLGATRKRTDRDKSANNFTGFDKDDDIRLAKFLADKENSYAGPYPLISATLNATVVSELDRQDRKAESFIFTPLYCGYDFSPTRSGAYAKHQVFEYGYRPTGVFAYEGGPMIGTAMAISGAAVNPNMGYHSSPATAFMLTMFNVRLGWWIGNPRLKTYNRSDPEFGVAYLVSDLIGKSDIESRFVCLSDGGHFDNMGLYELVRRRCRHITLCDAEEDSDSSCEGLANAIRRCRIDFGVEITIKTDPITKKDKVTGLCIAHQVNGTISYPGDKTPSGTILYIKTALNGDEPTDIREYHQNNPVFPQQPTSDQFFTEEQFESYRLLGYHSVEVPQLPIDPNTPPGGTFPK